MLSSNFLMTKEVYTEILSGLMADFVKYALKTGIDLKDKSLPYTEHYYAIVKEYKKSHFYNTEEELKHCKTVIDTSKKYFEDISE